MNTSLKDKTAKHKERAMEGKNSIIFAGGEKGGVGKTFFFKLLVLYAETRGWIDDICLVEAEPNIKDISRVYKEHEEVVFSDNRFNLDRPNLILDMVEEKSIFVNLPSSVSRIFDDWMSRLDMLGDAQEYYQEIVYYYVSDGCYPSIEYFTKHIERYGKTNMKTCLVLNPGRCSTAEDFSYLEKDSDFIKIVHEANVPIICLPILSAAHQYPIEKSGMRYQEYVDAKNKGLKTSDRTSLKLFIKESNRLFQKIYPDKISMATGIEQIREEQAEDRKQGIILVGEIDYETMKRRLF